MKTIYLCGGINSLTDSECKDWREEAKATLSGHYKLLDPMDRDYRGIEDCKYQEIVENDLADIDASHILLVMALRPSWGTAMEVFYASNTLKIIVTVARSPISPWLRYHSNVLFSTLTEALDYLKRLP